MDKIREILENLCDEDDENVRCTMIDLALTEIKKVWGEMVGEDKDVGVIEDVNKTIAYFEQGKCVGYNQAKAELRQNLT